MFNLWQKIKEPPKAGNLDMGLSVIKRHLGLLKQRKIWTAKRHFLRKSIQPVESRAR